MSSCGCFANLPAEPTTRKSQYIEDISGSVAVHVQSDRIATRFSWLVKTRKPIPDNAYLEAEFPDSDDPHVPYKVPVSAIKGGPEEEYELSVSVIY
jgi:hypothetical protein